MSDWTKFVTAYYKKKHASNPDYKFKNAMKDAAKEYKKGSSAAPSANKTKKSGKSKKMSGGKSKKSSAKSRKTKK
jgi:hypothetical protein